MSVIKSSDLGPQALLFELRVLGLKGSETLYTTGMRDGSFFVEKGSP